MRQNQSKKGMGAIPTQIIKPTKGNERPDQNHTPEGPAEEFIQEDLNTSKDEPTHRNTSVLKK